MHKLLKKKHTGVLLPLFSIYSDDDWGCGDVSSLEEWIDFFNEVGFDIIQILPLNELPPNTNCPYTSLTAFATDPIYLSIKKIKHLSPAIERKIKTSEFKQRIKIIKNLDYIDYSEIKKLKYEVLWEEYNYLVKEIFHCEPSVKYDFEKYCEENSWWLDDYALFRRLKDIYSFVSWEEWPEGLKEKRANDIEKFKKENEFEINFFKYIQWEIDCQLEDIKNKLKAKNIHLFGDIPFMVNKESADVWSRRYDFRLDLESGAPPDAFSSKGQRWGIPAPNWDSQIANNFEWWRLKLKKFRNLYDIFRIDHMVGFFRTWVIPINSGEPNFDILDPLKQEKRGRLFLKTITSSTDMLSVAEDLGVIPPFVRKVMQELEVPGYKIIRWEKDESQTQYIDPKNYPPISLATTSTHDTEPMNTWWKIIDDREKRQFIKMIKGSDKKIPSSYREIKDYVNEKLLSSPSRIVITHIPDIISSDERINTPNTVGSHNWTYRIKYLPERFYQKHRNDFDTLKEMINRLRK
ncbi:MAG: 4-alpha-glucanotransferase [Elusimicrobiales bacterium]